MQYMFVYIRMNKLRNIYEKTSQKPLGSDVCSPQGEKCTHKLKETWATRSYHHTIKQMLVIMLIYFCLVLCWSFYIPYNQHHQTLALAWVTSPWLSNGMYCAMIARISESMYLCVIRTCCKNKSRNRTCYACMMPYSLPGACICTERS